MCTGVTVDSRDVIIDSRDVTEFVDGDRPLTYEPVLLNLTLFITDAETK